MAARLEGSKLLIPLALLLAAGVLLAITAAGSYLAALPLLMSPTADVAFILFALAFAASSLARLLPNAGTRFLLRNRRYLGLGFAMVHFTHLALVLSSITLVAGQAREPATLVPGVIAAEISNALPVQGVAGFGSYELAMVLGGSMAAVPREALLAAAVNLHLFILACTLAFGALAWLIPDRIAVDER